MSEITGGTNMVKLIDKYFKHLFHLSVISDDALETVLNETISELCKQANPNNLPPIIQHNIFYCRYCGNEMETTNGRFIHKKEGEYLPHIAAKK